jgi:glutathione S-transferase
MKLHYASASPFVRKVMVVAIELGLDERIEKIETIPIPTDTNEALAADNPLAKIPALITDDGEVLYDSRLITAYLNDMGVAGGHAGLVPADGMPRWRVLRQEALCDGILDALVVTRYETAMRPEELRWDDWIDAQMGRATRGLAWLEQTLPYWKDGVGLATLASGCVLGYLDFRFDHVDWRSAQPGLAGWYEEFGQRPSMQATAPGA